jgi:thiamine kinase-like enzyme
MRGKGSTHLPAGQQVCHMDFHPDNILYSPNGPIVIDWMTAAMGSPYADVARTSVILRFGSLPPGVPEQIRLGLETLRNQFEKEYLQSYIQNEENQRAQVEQWFLPIMAARLCEGILKEEKDTLVKQIHQKLRNV